MGSAKYEALTTGNGSHDALSPPLTPGGFGGVETENHENDPYDNEHDYNELRIGDSSDGGIGLGYNTLASHQQSPSLGFSATTGVPLPLSPGVEDSGSNFGHSADVRSHASSISKVLKSLTGSQRSEHSYDLVEDDDFEDSQVTPRLPQPRSSAMFESTTAAGESPVRTASISRHLPLHNPIPDLQTVQGAYLKNVQALEDSAERLSLAGSIEEELRKLDFDLKRTESRGSRGAAGSNTDYHHRKYSSTSMSNSIIGVNAAARSGGYSPAGFITSPVGSVKSQRRPSQRIARVNRGSVLSNQLAEPELEGRPLESAMVHSPPSHAMQPRKSSDSQRSFSQASRDDRPGTSASNDTYRQAQNLFNDFDGTHFSPGPFNDYASRRISLAHPPLARDSRVFREEQPDQRTVYYPAPVPVMLNLPKRLSKHNWAQTEKRRTQVLSGIPQEMRKSAAWLANAETDAEIDFETPREVSKRMSTIPPQLRASAFFDAPGSTTDVRLKHGSAVMTLDKILDAAAHAPVSAFTDHPIAGHLGNEVYGKELTHKKKPSETKQAKRRSSLSGLLTKRKSRDALSNHRRLSQNLDNEVETPDDDLEKTAERSLAPGEDELAEDDQGRISGEDQDDEKSNADEEVESQHQLGFLGAPTTLLAELQMRKAQQKLRNRTAATAGPTGMHSTLLELDAVTQLQQKSRRQKHVALAWEDKEVVDRDNYDDDDVPLGVLYPDKEKQNQVNFNKPLGLMERRELEENEPLGARRARLRGEAYRPAAMPSPQTPVYEEPAPSVNLLGADDDEEVEGETLAQRRKRIQEKKDNKRTSLADDIASQLGIEAETIGGTKTPEPEVEETLGQRRKRLQAEAEKNGPSLKPKTSMGDLLRSNPVGFQQSARPPLLPVPTSTTLQSFRDTSMPLVGHIQTVQPGSKAIPASQPAQSAYFHNQPAVSQYYQATRQSPQVQQTAQPMQAMQNMMNMPQYHHFPMPNMYNPMLMPTSSIQMPMGGYMPQISTPSGFDPIGMGPPLTPQQRTQIDRWRQGIA